MARYLVIKAAKVANIVEYGATTPPDNDDDGNPIVLEVGFKSVGDAYDVTNDLQERWYAKADRVILKELLRLTNEIKALRAEAPLTVLQYKAQLKLLV